MKLSWWRDPAWCESILQNDGTGERVYVLDTMWVEDASRRATDEVRQLHNLWRREREACGCVQCLDELCERLGTASPQRRAVEGGG